MHDCVRHVFLIGCDTVSYIQEYLFCVIVVFWTQLERGGYTLLYPEELYSQEIMAHIRLNQMECTLLLFFFIEMGKQCTNEKHLYWEQDICFTSVLNFFIGRFLNFICSWWAGVWHSSKANTEVCVEQPPAEIFWGQGAPWLDPLHHPWIYWTKQYPWVVFTGTDS